MQTYTVARKKYRFYCYNNLLYELLQRETACRITCKTHRSADDCKRSQRYVKVYT